MSAFVFSDIAKGPKDLLTDDYTNKVSLKCKKGAGPVAVTIETERGSAGALSSKIGTKFAYAGLSFDKAQAKADGGTVLETSFKPADGLKISFKGNKGADLGVDYTKGALYTTATFDVKDMSKLSASACFGVHSGINIGGDTTYALSGKTGISAFNVGASYAKGPAFVALTTASKCSQFNIGATYKVNNALSLGSQTTHSAEKTFDLLAVGGSYKAPFGTVKAKIEGSGVVNACLVKGIADKVTLTASGSCDPADIKSFKYGIGISM